MEIPDKAELNWNGKQGEVEVEEAEEAGLKSGERDKATPLGAISLGDVMPGKYSMPMTYLLALAILFHHAHLFHTV